MISQIEGVKRVNNSKDDKGENSRAYCSVGSDGFDGEGVSVRKASLVDRSRVVDPGEAELEQLRA